MIGQPGTRHGRHNVEAHAHARDPDLRQRLGRGARPSLKGPCPLPVPARFGRSPSCLVVRLSDSNARRDAPKSPPARGGENRSAHRKGRSAAPSTARLSHPAASLPRLLPPPQPREYPASPLGCRTNPLRLSDTIAPTTPAPAAHQAPRHSRRLYRKPRRL